MPRGPYKEPALNYAGQLQQLKDRGLIVENDAKALHLLENINDYCAKFRIMLSRI